MNLILACAIIIQIESILSSIALQQSERILSAREIKLTGFAFAFPSKHLQAQFSK